MKSIIKISCPGIKVPANLLFQPDFLENKEDWPFFRGENEYVIDISTAYIFLSNAVIDLVSKLVLKYIRKKS